MTELEGKFRIIRSLGTGAGGETFEAEDLRDGARVAVKRLVLANASDWKKVDLFQREARVLASLHHPAIPRYRDSFVVETAQGPISYLVHDFAPGQSLRGWVESGWRADEGEIVRIGAFLLDVLGYLHSLYPAVLHRDVKPANVIRSDDGRLWLVDFGAVRDATSTMTGGSTVVGTYGYMAPEQFRGHAVPASDIYGVGATLLYLLGGKAPTDYPQEKLKVAFRGHVRVSPFVARWIERALEPVPEERFPNAFEALAVLRGQKRLEHVVKKPYDEGKRIKILVSILSGLLLVMVVVGLTDKVSARLHERPSSHGASPPTSTPATVQRLPERPNAPRVACDQRIFEGRHTNVIHGVAVSPDDQTLAAAADSVIKLWDIKTGREIRSMGGHGARIPGAHFFADGKRLLTIGGRTMKTWDVATGKELSSVDIGHEAYGAQATSDDKIAVTGGPDGIVQVWDVEKGSVIKSWPFDRQIYDLALDNRGARVALGGRDGTVAIFTIPDGQRTATWKAHLGTAGGVAFSPDGNFVASAGDDRRVALTALTSRGLTQLAAEFPNQDEAWGVAFSPDGHLLATMSKDNTVGFVSMTGEYRLQTIGMNVPSSRGAFSHDGRRFFVAAGVSIVSYAIAKRGYGTVIPEPRTDLVDELPPRDDDHRTYLELLRFMTGWPHRSNEEIEAKIKAAQAANPKSPLVWIANAHFEVDRGYVNEGVQRPESLPKARESLAKAEALGPKTVEWWNAKARVETRARDFAATREAIRQGNLVSPKYPMLVLAEATVDVKEHKYQPAVEVLVELLRTTNRRDLLDDIYSELGHVYSYLGDIDASERAYQKAMALDPKNAWLREAYAMTLEIANELDHAAEEAKAALTLMDYGHGRATLARIYAGLGDRKLWEQNDPDGALNEYQQAIGLDNNSARAYYGRAAVYRSYAFDGKGTGHIGKARADLVRAKQIAAADKDDPWPQPTQAERELAAVEARSKKR